MRISDWSSDVCSSDLIDVFWQQLQRAGFVAAENALVFGFHRVAEFFQAPVLHDDLDARVMNVVAATEAIEDPHDRGRIDQQVRFRHERFGRSEEHTSELQSLMRISYAVFCLKKKTTKQT